MKQIGFLFCFLVLLVISCNSARRVADQSGEIAEGEAKIVKLQPDKSEEGGTAAQSAKAAPAPQHHSAAPAGKLSPEAKALLEQLRKEEESRTVGWEKRANELKAELEKIGSSAANLEEANACVAEANKLFAERNYEEAAAKYREALDHYPLHEEAQTKLTECYRILTATEGEEGETDLAPQEERLLLRQKFASGEQLFAENNLDEAAAKFREVMDMVTWSKKKIDTQNYLGRAKEYLQKIEEKKKESAQPEKQEDAPQK